jgi:hypothetical protein
MIWLFVSIAFMCGITAFAWVFYHTAVNPPPKPFNASAWQSQKHPAAMAQDLKSVLYGKTRAEVLSLLGPPNSTEKNTDTYVLTAFLYELLQVIYQGGKVIEIRHLVG